MSNEKVEKSELGKDLHSLQSKMSNSRSDKEYLALKMRMKAFMQTTKRSWANTLIFLLNQGLDVEEQNNKILENAKTNK